MLVRYNAPETGWVDAVRHSNGTEAEYDTQQPGETLRETRDGELLAPSVVRRAQINAFIPHESSTYWLPSGGNIHPDVGRVEYSSFEGDDARSMALGNFVGMRTVQRLVAAQPGARAFLHSGTLVTVPGHNGDKVTTFRTLGFHESDSMPYSIARVLYEEIAGITDADQATRIWAWGGMVGLEGMELSQKARGIGNPTLPHVGARTSEGNKPMGWIKLDDSDMFYTPQGKSPTSVRVERRVVDGNYSRWAKWMSGAMGSLVLRFAEHRRIFKDDPLRVLPFADPVNTLKRVSLDLSMSNAYRTREGRYRTAIETQERIAQYGDELRREVWIPNDEYEAVDELFMICDRLKQCRLLEGYVTPIMRHVDFGPRMAYLIKQGFEPHQIRSDNRKALDHNFAWNRFQPTGPGLQFWENVYKKGKAPDPVGDHLIDLYMDTPYPGTRAALRGAVASDPRMRKRINSLGWRHIEIDGKVLWLDSFDNDPEMLARRGWGRRS